MRDILFCFGTGSWLSDAEPFARNRMVEMTWVSGLKIKKKLISAKIEACALRMIVITPIDQRVPLPPSNRGDFMILDVPLDWDHFRSIEAEADDDALRDLICAAALRALGKIGQESGLPVAQLCGFVQETPTHPDYWYHQFKTLILDQEAITVTRRIGIDRPLFTCRVPQVMSGAA